MKLSIIIPVYNEQDTLKELLAKIQRVQLNGVLKEIIIVDDSSNDRSKSIFDNLKSSDIIKLYHKHNQGKAAAIKTGLVRASGDLILIQDGDLEYDPSDYPALLEPILSNQADVVYGSRFLTGKNKAYFPYLVANKFLVWLTNILYGSCLTDMETCYKLFRKEILVNLKIKAKGFEFEPEVTAKLLLRKVQIMEVPISYVPRSKKMGKKIGFFDGLMSIYILIKYKLAREAK
ncbi:MAG: glycosyltransferase family 2 protein [Candidatus Omnitrophica bacterium]|nr:glycosyltransferase family 2 protein [Candidatus Omnitrophota bacterium]